MSTERLEELVGLSMPTWQQALQEYLAATGRTDLEDDQ